MAHPVIHKILSATCVLSVQSFSDKTYLDNHVYKVNNMEVTEEVFNVVVEMQNALRLAAQQLAKYLPEEN